MTVRTRGGYLGHGKSVTAHCVKPENVHMDEQTRNLIQGVEYEGVSPGDNGTRKRA